MRSPKRIARDAIKGAPPTAARGFISMEKLLTSPAGFGLTTATPLQRAICRVSDGLSIADLFDAHDEVRLAFGGTCPAPGVTPDAMIILAGVRGAKSLFCAAKAVQVSQNCDISHVSAGDELRIPVLATDKDMAHVVFQHICGHLQSNATLKHLIIGEPTADSVLIKHPSGRAIEIKVTALARYASTLIGRWLPACIFDEAPRMVGTDDGVRNLGDSLTAIAGRMLGPIMMIGSPWAPFGDVYNLTLEHFGRPSKKMVVIRAKAPWLNPVWWTPERCEELRLKDPKAYKTDVEAEFADPEEAPFPSDLIASNTRAGGNLAPEPHIHYVACMDPATRRNAWTLTIVGNYGFQKSDALQIQYKVVYTKQWIGSSREPLKPAVILGEVAEILGAYNLHEALTDQHSFDALQDIAERFGLTLVDESLDAADRLEAYGNLKLLFEAHALELPSDPYMRSDLLGVRKRITQNGYTIVLPRTGDGRHADFAPPLALTTRMLPGLPDEPEPWVDKELAEARAHVKGKSADFWGGVVAGLTGGKK